VSRYVIIGAGGVGVTLAAELHRAGRRVVLVARGAQLASLQAGELRYSRPGGTRTLDLPFAGDPADVELTSDDVLVLATKTQDAEAVISDWAWRPVRHADGTQQPAAGCIPVVTTQNGLETERIALRRFATVLAGVLWVPATYVKPGEVVSAGAPAAGVLWLGAYPSGSDPRLAAIADDVRASDFEVQVVEDITRWKAAKLLASVTFVLAALYPASELRDQAALVLRQEARDVLTAAGYGIADVAAESTTADLRRFAVQPIAGREPGGNSTWQSLARSSPLETDFLNGEIVLAARLLGKTAPASEAVLERVHRAWREDVPAGSLSTDDLLTVLPGLRANLPGLRAEQQAESDVLIDATTLRKLLDEPDPPAVLDVRWALGDTHGRDHYQAGHIPTAVYVDLDTSLTGPPHAGAGRHPLPDAGALQEAARDWGLRAGQPVVVYDDIGGLAAARAWWLLKWAGLDSVRILDGALKAWKEAGLELSTSSYQVTRGDVRLDAGQLPVLTADDAAALARDGGLLDARAGERYRGDTEPIDPRAGHIPGALSAPTTGNLAAGGTFASAQTLLARYAELGIVPGRTVGVYCGSGVTATHAIAALRIAGIDAALFPGSWSAWSADPRRPVATGPDPGLPDPGLPDPGLPDPGLEAAE
jgi:thiosulfate/3-mercaptopyruvate sulfurtransferase